MTHLAIIADDLSSATDCGAQVARSGQPVLVPLHGYGLPAQLPARAGAAKVISVDTDSRSAPGERAYAVVKEAASVLTATGWQHFYKSVDSTLRGNLGAEISAVLDVVRPDCAIVAPAFPSYGRTTADGVQFLRGVPLNETEFGTDPTAPVREANIVRLLSQQTHRKVGHLPLEPLRQGPAQVAHYLERLISDGIELVVCDVQEQEDLRRICTHIAASGVRVVWVGSTGLSEFVPLALGLHRTGPLPADTRPEPVELDSRPALVIAGSASATTRQQLQHALTTAGLRLITLDPLTLISGGAETDHEIDRSLLAIRAAVREGRDVGLTVSSSRDDIAATQKLGAELGLPPAHVARRIAETLATICQSVTAEGNFSGVVATGGDTAKAICDVMHAEALEILGEVEAGIPLMRLLGPTSLPLVTKAGGFGSPAAIVHSIKRVKQNDG
jgi:D-threonate/D-erythronate kinase